MKRILSLVLVCVLVLCSCSMEKKYKKAYDETVGKKEFTVTVDNTLTVTGDGAEEVYTDKVRYAQSSGALCAKVTNDDGYAEYYFKDGNVYSVTDAGEYSWAATAEEFFADICYAKPLDYSFADGKKDGDTLVYTVELDGDEYSERLLSVNPVFEDMKLSEADFTAFTYTVYVKDGSISAYTYDFTFTAKSGETYATLTNVMKVTYEEKADNITMPENYVGFEMLTGNISDISEEAFEREVMMIIVETLYNADGTRKDDFDENYAEFVAMYGEETMSTFIGGIEQYNQSIGVTN